jgi:hypothetical protein
VENFTTGKQRGRMMIHRCGNRFMHSRPTDVLELLRSSERADAIQPREL